VKLSAAKRNVRKTCSIEGTWIYRSFSNIKGFYTKKKEKKKLNVFVGFEKVIVRCSLLPLPQIKTVDHFFCLVT
jgi:hypothetical protein